jgi:NDP-sugar pyrophosphorylase family protein
MQTMKAIILLGGKGTRLSGLFPDLPKALVPVNGRPFLARQIDWLFSQGFHSILLAAGYMGDKISAWVRRQSFHDRISVSLEPTPLGTGGALK